MLTLILAESALETVPQELWRQPAVKRSSERRRKQSKFIILDRSLHHSAMKTLKDGEKRGRPDIVHLSLLEALGSPLNKEGLLKVYVHTFNDYVISVSPQTRLPRNYNRFIGLMEQLFEYGRAPPRGMPLLTMEKRSFSGLVEIIKPTYIIAFSRIGKPAILDETISNLINEENLLAIVGGFPSGHFTEAIQSLADEVLCIDPEMLEAWTIVSRLIYEYERAFTLPRKRIEMIIEK
ncbi:MAG: 16S rRNA methyltransferase [Candidatus Bathyarchaeia archaeon]